MKLVSLSKFMFALALVLSLTFAFWPTTASQVNALPQYCDYFIDCPSSCPTSAGCTMWLNSWTCNDPVTFEQRTYSLYNCEAACFHCKLAPEANSCGPFS